MALGENIMILINSLALIIISTLCIVFSICLVRTNIFSIKQLNFNNYTRIFLLIFVFLFSIIRIYKFGSIPNGINQDEAMAAVDAKALADYGTDRFGTWLPAHFYAWGYGQMSVLLSYCMIPFIKIFGLNSISIRLPILIASLLGIIAVYFVVKKLINNDVAIVAALVTSINPWHFMQSRWALDCNMFPHMFIIGFLFLLYGINKKPFIYVSMIFFALCMYSYGVSFYMVPLFLLTSAIALIRLKLIKFRVAVFSAVIYGLLSFPIFFTMFINAAGLKTVVLPFVTMQSFPDNERTNAMLLFSDNPFSQLLTNIKTTIEVLLFQKPDRFWNTISGFGSIYLCSAPLVLLGFVICIYRAVKEKDQKNRAKHLLLIIYASCSVLVGVFINRVNINRINIVLYSNIIFCAISIYYLIAWKKYNAFIIGTIYSVLFVLFLNNYFTVWSDEIKYMFNYGFLEALDYADSLDFDTCYITPETQFWCSEILTLYEMKIDARYFQGQTNTFKDKQIPYNERFIYSNPIEYKPGYDKNTVYIITSDSYNYYDFSEWNIKEFDGYYVVSAG